MSEQHLDSFTQQQKQAYDRVNQYLLDALNALPFTDLPLAQAMRYGTLLGGKRLRPFLTYAIGSMFGVSQENLDAPAAAVECIH
ncbi:(2E,6E)-farnesyl diphosphate synthase, partial [Escherichia coli]|nr:(2E,6E)-farnesyl diphosphate synthase [Escherichia coli]